MCGIVAITGELQSHADSIVTALGHRGPDSGGAVSLEVCTLAIARLAIMDPDARSDQPMELAGRTLVYNGEIYNFADLRRDLEGLGHHFRTKGDTEVLLHAVVEWGVEAACARLEGMFAFALWDSRSQSLHLARDSFGIKPLYWLGDGRGVVAASEVAPLAAAFGLRPRADAIREFLRFGSPVTNVAYERVAELEPGSILTWHERSLRIHPFATLAEGPLDPAAAARAGIARQLRSDRPTALFLSGGFDSTLLAAVAAQVDVPVTALTLATGDNAEEVRLAAETARHYGLAHEVATVDDHGLARSAGDFLEAMDQPTVDGFNTFLVSRAAIDRGFPVALSGLGGDETLGGYGYSRRLRQVHQAQRVWGHVPAGLQHRAAAAIAPRIGQPASRLAAILGAGSVAATWMAWRRLFDDEEIRALTGAVTDPSPRWLTDVEAPARAQLRHLDFTVYLRATLLRDADVFSMANSVEVRVPLLDRALVRSCERAELTKRDLAQLMGDDLLTTRALAPKLPFGLPWRRWLPLLEPSFEDVLATTGGPFAEMIDVARAPLACRRCALRSHELPASLGVGGPRALARARPRGAPARTEAGMRLLLFGELGAGALARSFEPGLAAVATVLGTDPYRSRPDRSEPASSVAGRMASRIRYRARVAQAGATLVETVEQLRPDAVLIVKGRGVDAGSITRVRRLGVPVALYYPDNPAWAFADTSGVRERLAACTLVVLWSERLAAWLESAGARTRVLPFGYDDRWWVPTPPGGDRYGIVFLGQWSPRRERYLAALEGLPLTVRGAGWDRTRVPAGPPVFGPEAGAVLAGAVIGVNLLHPQCAGAHNMRTREIAAAGALQLTDPGTDGTPLRPPGSCAWFESPAELRARAEHYLSHPDEAAAIASGAQVLTRDETYIERGRTLARWLGELA